MLSGKNERINRERNNIDIKETRDKHQLGSGGLFHCLQGILHTALYFEHMSIKIFQRSPSVLVNSQKEKCQNCSFTPPVSNATAVHFSLLLAGQPDLQVIYQGQCSQNMILR